ncbi:MAG: threonine dehydratase [Proteobacteria bacterium]|nr:threonine dehydratase [Pseudomonadota bacterium]
MSKPDLATLQTAAELVYRSMTPTAQIRWPLLEERCGCEVWVKHENHTPTGAFKIRGGLVYMDDFARRHPDTAGVIAATRGNHGQSVAYAARAQGVAAVIVAPLGNSAAKNKAMRAYGAELIEHGDDFNAALDHAVALAGERGLHMMGSYDDLLVRGVASYSLELLAAAPDLDALYVPIGLGSGICGAIAARDALNLKTSIVGVVSDKAAAYALSFEARKPVSTDSADTFADGMAVRVPNPDALDVILAGVERVVTVSDEEILAAMGHYFDDTHNIAEGAGAAPLAALLKEREAMAGKSVGLILSGGNLDRDLYMRALAQG